MGAREQTSFPMQASRHGSPAPSDDDTLAIVVDVAAPIARQRDRGRLLFLCTGNYYRSRFAEELWRHLERLEPSGWRAESRGLWVARGRANVGPISPHALDALDVLGVRLNKPVRFPRQVVREDLQASARIVAMSESEHRAMINSLFPEWARAIEYWDVEDIELCPVGTAMERLSARVRALRLRLCRSD
jgi:protein-tyrosine phosphatase